jgi:hypothetical protein
MKRALLWISIAVLGTAHLVSAQARSSDLPKVGAVIGFRVLTPGANPRTNAAAYKYETWLVVRDDSGVHVAAKLGDIIVPRKDGFWRLGVQPVCEFFPPDPDHDQGQTSTEAIAYAVPLAQAPTLAKASTPCDEKTTARVFSPSFDPDADEAPDAGPTQCGYSTVWFEGVLPDLVSLESHEGSAEACEPRGFHWTDRAWVQSPERTFDSFDPRDMVTLDSIFGPAANTTWLKVIRADFRQQGGVKETSCGDLDFSSLASDITGWFFEHAGGVWDVLAFDQPGDGGCQLGGDLNLEMPRRLTGEPPLPKALSANLLAPDKKHVMDAWVSPEDRLLLRQSRALTQRGSERVIGDIEATGVFALDRTAVGRQLLALPDHDIIMVQWATGRFVDQWVETLGQTAAKGLPPVKLISTSN